MKKISGLAHLRDLRICDRGIRKICGLAICGLFKNLVGHLVELQIRQVAAHRKNKLLLFFKLFLVFTHFT
jgi:hypothetical protein